MLIDRREMRRAAQQGVAGSCAVAPKVVVSCCNSSGNWPEADGALERGIETPE